MNGFGIGRPEKTFGFPRQQDRNLTRGDCVSPRDSVKKRLPGASTGFGTPKAHPLNIRSVSIRPYNPCPTILGFMSSRTPTRRNPSEPNHGGVCCTRRRNDNV